LAADRLPAIRASVRSGTGRTRLMSIWSLDGKWWWRAEAGAGHPVLVSDRDDAQHDTAKER
jgi:hypothetical protein